MIAAEMVGGKQRKRERERGEKKTRTERKSLCVYVESSYENRGWGSVSDAVHSIRVTVH